MGFGIGYDCKHGGRSTDTLIIIEMVLLLIVLATDSGLFSTE